MKTQINRFAFILALAIIALTGINAKVSSELFVPEQEPELRIESWMTEDYHWTNAKITVTPEQEQELAIESWMYDDTYWR